jgi:hypothetical protein
MIGIMLAIMFRSSTIGFDCKLPFASRANCYITFQGRSPSHNDRTGRCGDHFAAMVGLVINAYYSSPLMSHTHTPMEDFR